MIFLYLLEYVINHRAVLNMNVALETLYTLSKIQITFNLKVDLLDSKGVIIGQVRLGYIGEFAYARSG